MSYTNYNTTFRRNKITLPPGARMESLFTPTLAQAYALGMILELDDGTGRMFRYCKDGGSGQTKAQMGCSLPIDAEGINIAQTAYGHAAGLVKFDVLLTTANGITDNCLIDGYMLVNQGAAAGLGDLYIINDNKWTTSDTVLNIILADEGGLRNAIAATDEIVIARNICRDTKQFPTSIDASAIGVPLVSVTASYYYWAQYRGIAPLLQEASETVVAGEPVGVPSTYNTAGAAGPIGAYTDAIWGVCVCAAHTNQSTPDVMLVNLMLP